MSEQQFQENSSNNELTLQSICVPKSLEATFGSKAQVDGRLDSVKKCLSILRTARHLEKNRAGLWWSLVCQEDFSGCLCCEHVV